MPPPRKIDLLPEELRRWLKEELRKRNFSDYEALAEDLAFRCEEEGVELRIGKSAIHAYGQDFRDYARAQEEAQDQIRTFLEEASLTDEANVTKALFQQLTTLQWRLQMSMATSADAIDPRGMKDLTTALNNLIRSTALRDAILSAERKAQSEKLDAAVEAGDIDRAAAEKARSIMGFS
ncbi:phage protein Gp27 family protein (plasmid) [Thioclava sp. 'Guangxiensis']|uniref:phage protein Gp27 family protein n=1 Tax=Thioclava sp. 'Guangxiensis' TaxID=3149044 RepID=UPI0032C493F4